MAKKSKKKEKRQGYDPMAPIDTSEEAVGQFGAWLCQRVDALPPGIREEYHRRNLLLLEMWGAYRAQQTTAAAARSRITVTVSVPELPSGTS